MQEALQTGAQRGEAAAVGWDDFGQWSARRRRSRLCVDRSLVGCFPILVVLRFGPGLADRLQNFDVSRTINAVKQAARLNTNFDCLVPGPVATANTTTGRSPSSSMRASTPTA